MCYYVTAILPTSADDSLLAAIAQRHDRNFQPLTNPSIEAHLKPGERYFLTTRGHCDCGTLLGDLAREERKTHLLRNAIDVEEEKLKRKGWSDAKIARWREQKLQHLAKRRANESATDWLAFLQDVLNSGGTPFVSLLLHWYNGPIEGRIELQGREAIALRDLGTEILGRMKEDVVYEFRARA